MKRVVAFAYWFSLLFTIVASMLFATTWISHDIHSLTNYGFAGARHRGYDTLFQLLFFALPAGVFLALTWLMALVRRTSHTRAMRLPSWITGAIASAALLLWGFELVLDHLGDRERAAAESARLAAVALASNHDQLAAFARDRGVSQPLTPNGVRPLQAAIENHFPDLVAEFVQKGAAPSENDLQEAVQLGDRTIVETLLRDGDLRGYAAVEEAFEAGDASMQALLVAHHLDVHVALLKAIDPTRFGFRPGEVSWEKLATAWHEARPKELLSFSDPDFPRGEKEVLAGLQSMLSSVSLCSDAAGSPSVEPWMKERRLCDCNYCPYGVQIKWAVLTNRYSFLPKLAQSRHMTMLRALAREAVQANADPKPILRTAASNENVFLLETLEAEGFNVRDLDGEFSNATFLNVTEAQRMKAHLLSKGVRLREQ